MMFRALAARQRALVSLAVAAFPAAEPEAGVVPPLACFRNASSMAWYRPTSSRWFGGIPLATRMRSRLALGIPWACALSLACL